MQVKEIMTKNIIAINSDESLLDTCKKYRVHKVGSLVVMDNDIIVGIVTERDIIESMVSINGDPKRTKVRDIMTPSDKNNTCPGFIRKSSRDYERAQYQKTSCGFKQ